MIVEESHVHEAYIMVLMHVFFFSACMAFRHPWMVYSKQVDGSAFCVACATLDYDTGCIHVLEKCSFADCLYNPSVKEVLMCYDG